MPDGRLLARVKYPRLRTSPPEAAIAAPGRSTRDIAGRGSDFLPVTFQVPVAVCVLRVGGGLLACRRSRVSTRRTSGRARSSSSSGSASRHYKAKLVTFNGRGFDLPLLELAAFRYGISAREHYLEQPQPLSTAQSTYGLALQLRRLPPGRRPEPAGEVARQAGQDGRGRRAGYQMFRDGKLQEINDYCLCDTLDTYFVFLRTRILTGDINLEQEAELVAKAKGLLESKVGRVPGAAKVPRQLDGIPVDVIPRLQVPSRSFLFTSRSRFSRFLKIPIYVPWLEDHTLPAQVPPVPQPIPAGEAAMSLLKLLGIRPRDPRPSRSLKTSLGVENLEDRTTPNVSSLFDSSGQFFQAIVHQNSNLTLSGPSGTQVLATKGVRVVHLFRDVTGGIGFDVVRVNGKAFETDHTGTHKIGGNRILNMSRTYDSFGHFQLAILTAQPAATTPFGPNLQGNLKVITNSGVSTVSATARWVSTYLDVNGGLGMAFGEVDGSGNLVVTRSDSTGSVRLYKAPNGATQDITDYSQTSNSFGQVVVNITFGRFAGSYSLQFGPTGTSLVGNGTNIQVGG